MSISTSWTIEPIILRLCILRWHSTMRKSATTCHQIIIPEPSETFRSVIFLFLSFLKCSEAWISYFWAFWNVQKHKIPFFEPSEMFGSVNFCFLSFLKCSEAWFSDFRFFWNVQKRVSHVNDYIKLGKSILRMGSRLKVSYIYQGKRRSLLCDFIWPNELLHEIRSHKKGYESLLIF